LRKKDATLKRSERRRNIDAFTTHMFRQDKGVRRQRYHVYANSTTGHSKDGRHLHRARQHSPLQQPTWNCFHRIYLIIQTAATRRVPRNQTELVGTYRMRLANCHFGN
jgi:hypothetical protein